MSELTLQSWLQKPREEWQKKTLIPKIHGSKQGERIYTDDDVLVLEAYDDTFEVAVSVELEREAKRDEQLKGSRRSCSRTFPSSGSKRPSRRRRTDWRAE